MTRTTTMRHSAGARHPGFTLLELLVGMTVSLLVFSATTEVMVRLNTQRRVQQKHAELDRDAMLATGWLRRDFAGAGVGDATDMMDATGVGVGGGSMQPFVRGFDAINVDDDREFCLLADVARPDTNFDGFFPVAANTITTGSPYTSIPVVSELSGRVNTSGAARGAGSILQGSACASASDPGCPWGLRKLTTMTGQTAVQIVVPNDMWVGSVVTGLQPGVSGVDPSGTVHGITVNPGSFRVPNRPFVTGRVIQLDRIGYRFRRITSGNWAPGVLERRQCWAAPDFTQATATQMGGATPSTSSAQATDGAPFNCATGANGNDTGWQVLARNLIVGSATGAAGSSKFKFYDANGNALTPPLASGQVRAVEAVLEFDKRFKVGRSSKTFRLTLAETFFIRR